MKKQWMFENQWWNKKYCIEPGEGGAGGNGAGGGEGAKEGAKEGAGGEGSKEGEGAKPPVIDPVEYENLKKEHASFKEENGRLNTLWNNVSEKVEYDSASGEFKIKNPKKKEGEETPQEMINRGLTAIESARNMESSASEKFKSDPFYTENFPKAKEYVDRLSPEKRTIEAWTKAMAMARGENSEKIIAWAKAEGKKEALAEWKSKGGASIPGGSGSKSDNGELDESKVTLSQQELEVANRMVKSGMIKSVESYKKNKISMMKAGKWDGE
jgi:hypothetical protein